MLQSGCVDRCLSNDIFFTTYSTTYCFVCRSGNCHFYSRCLLKVIMTTPPPPPLSFIVKQKRKPCPLYENRILEPSFFYSPTSSTPVLFNNDHSPRCRRLTQSTCRNFLIKFGKYKSFDQSFTFTLHYFLVSSTLRHLMYTSLPLHIIFITVYICFKPSALFCSSLYHLMLMSTFSCPISYSTIKCPCLHSIELIYLMILYLLILFNFVFRFQ